MHGWFWLFPQNNQKKMCKMLHHRGGNISTQNRQGQTALHFAFAFGYTELGKWLVKKNADTTLKNMNGMTCYEGLSQAQPAMPFVSRYVKEKWYSDSASYITYNYRKEKWQNGTAVYIFLRSSRYSRKVRLWTLFLMSRRSNGIVWLWLCALITGQARIAERYGCVHYFEFWG